jgi:hypothetical protein
MTTENNPHVYNKKYFETIRDWEACMGAARIN